MLLSVGALLCAVTGIRGQQTGNHQDWPRWCGKVYEDGYPAFDPGGQTLPPLPVSGPPLLDIQFQPRYSLYLGSESQGEFVVNAPLSQSFGRPWTKSKRGCRHSLKFTISVVSNTTTHPEPLVSSHFTINTTGTTFPFSLKSMTPSLSPVPLLLTAGNYTATSTLLYLPTKPTGSTTRIDNLSGGLFHSSPTTKHNFVPLFPYGFYASYDNFLANTSTSNTSAIDTYTSAGLNAMTPLTTLTDASFALAYLSSLDIKIMYDLRENYKNTSFVQTQATVAPTLDSLFAYWSADEPDGWQDPFSAPLAAQSVLHAVDPYHPVAVVLNCQNYYYPQYSAAGDIIMEDVYPIGIDPSFSKWNTTCNTTLGDCGCDNCAGSVFDVSHRLDDLANYERWANLWPKTKFHNPQSFHGEGYWARDPTAEEEWVMVLLAVNHGAKGVISWVYPAAEGLVEAHGRLAKVLTVEPVVDYVVGGGRARKVDVGVDGVDVAVWEREGSMLVSVANGGGNVKGLVTVPVPRAERVEGKPWGGLEWTLDGEQLSISGLPAMSTSLLILELSQHKRKEGKRA